MNKRFLIAVQACVSMVAVAAMLVPMTASAASDYSKDVKEAQTIMTKFGIPTGKIDGYYGENTARGLCAARQVIGYTPNRNKVSTSLLDKMRKLNTTYTGANPLQKISAPDLDGHSTYLLILQQCQAMFYVENGHYVRVMAVSTGTKIGQRGNDGEDHRTPNGTYYLGYTDAAGKPGSRHPAGWSCSDLYPESCSHRPGVGEYSKYSDYGNMYDKRQITGSIYLHGSTAVPARPASHGCVRVTPADSDYMYKHVGNDSKPYLKITGAF